MRGGAVQRIEAGKMLRGIGISRRKENPGKSRNLQDR